MTELTREELLVENKRLLGALQRLGEAYQIREQNFADYVLATKDTRASADRYRLAWVNARQRAAAYVEALEDTADERDALRGLVRDSGRYRLAWLSARRRSAYAYGEMGVVLWINQQLERVP